MKKLLLALTFILFAQSAWAQGNPTCPTRPFGDNSNACASTAFVQAAVIGACTSAGAFEVGTGTSSQCSNVAGSTAVLNGGPLTITASTNPLTVNGSQFTVTIPGTISVSSPVAGSLFFGQVGPTPADAGATQYTNVWSNYTGASGKGGGFLSLLADATTNGTWTPAASGLSGPTGALLRATSSVGGNVFGANSYALCLTVAATSCVSFEADTDNRINATATKIGIQIVDVAQSTGTVTAAGNIALRLSNQTGAYGFDTGILIDDAAGSGSYAVRTTGTLIKSGAATVATGIDLSALTISGNAWTSPGSTVITGAGKVGIGATPQIGSGGSTLNLEVSLNVTTPPTPAQGNIARFSGVDTGINAIELAAYGNSNNIVYNRANNTLASRTGLVANDLIGRFTWKGWTSAGAISPANTSSFSCFAAETWSGTQTGTYCTIGTTPLGGSIAIIEALRVQGSGGLSIGTTTDLGVGTVLANGAIKTLSSTASTTSTTGSGIFGGGVGVAGDIHIAGNVTFDTAIKTVVLKQGANGSVGTFICTGAGTITISNTNFATSDTVVISMAVAGGTITTPPAFKTVTGATGFTVLCGATDTSTYNYAIIKNAAWLLSPANDNEPFPWADKAFA